MRKTEKSVAMLLTLALLTLAACGGGSDGLLNDPVSDITTGNDKEEEDPVTYVATISAGDNPRLASVLATLIDGVELDASGNALIYQTAIDATTSLDLSGRSLTSLAGIEYFVNLTSLNCSNNTLGTLTLTALTRLTHLYCSSCSLTELNITALTRLVYLDCSDNALTAIDLSKHTALQELYCHTNRLTIIDLSACTALTTLQCYGNALTAIDLSALTKLIYLDCSDNALTALDVSRLTALQTLRCHTNRLSVLDVSVNIYLTVLVCYGNLLTELDISTLSALATLICGGQADNGSLDLLLTDAQKALWNSTWATETQNTNVAVGGSWVAVVYASDNATLATTLSELLDGVVLDGKGNARIYQTAIDATTGLDLSGRGLTSLAGLEHFVNLTSLNVSGNTIGNFSLPTLTRLTHLYVSSCSLTDIDLSGHTQLIYLDCSDNQLTTIDLSRLTLLQELYCHTNRLTVLDVSIHIYLTILYCHGNQLSTLDIRAPTALATLVCGGQSTGRLTLVMTTAQRSLWLSTWHSASGNEEVTYTADTGSISGSDYGDG